MSEPTLREHLKRIAGLMTEKKHAALVENLKKARRAKMLKRMGGSAPKQPESSKEQFSD